MNPSDTIAAVSSPPGAAPRGIVRLSGPRAWEIAAEVFDPEDGQALADRPAPAFVDGFLKLGPCTFPAAAALFRAPRSYTRQDVVELHLLGAPGLLTLLMERLLALGARPAEPGEFTARAFLAGAMDLTQVHGVAGMIAARSDHQLQAARRLLQGDLSAAAQQAREELADLLSLVEGAMDFADEPIEFITPDELRGRLTRVRDALADVAAAGLRAERWSVLPRVLLTGPPNAGKSSLLNRLSGLDRAICAAVAGTTRDVLTAPLELDRIDCLLVDAAGLTDLSGDPLQSRDRKGAVGVQNRADTQLAGDQFVDANPCEPAAGDLDAKAQAVTRAEFERADLILHVVDVMTLGDVRPEPAPLRTQAPALLVLNKCDLAPAALRLAERLSDSTDRPAVAVSAATGEGCAALKQRIESLLVERPHAVQDVAIALMAEHHEALQRALRAVDEALLLASDSTDSLADADLVAAELHIAADELGRLVGKEDTEEMLGRIFARFCVGK